MILRVCLICIAFEATSYGADEAAKIASFEAHVQSKELPPADAARIVATFKENIAKIANDGAESKPPTTKEHVRVRIKVAASGEFTNVDEGGLVKFRLHGHKWVDVLDWCSSISHKTFVWDQLPDSKAFIGVSAPVTTK